MQLDRTHIAIRERDIFEILDLSLHIVRDYFRPLALTLLLGALPLALINHLLIGWMLNVEFGLQYPIRFIWMQILLVTLEAPLATPLITAYLGRAVFDRSPGIREAVVDVFRQAPRIAWCELLWRGVLAGWLLVLLIERRYGSPFWVDGLWLPILVVYAMSVRLIRPFIMEIVVLEQNPLRRSERETLSVGRRSAMLHNPSVIELIGRGFMCWTFGIALVLVLIGGMLCMSGVFLHDWKQGPWMIGFCFPLALWTVVGFFAVVRFLNYLDCRIRQEGWEVEILLMAEANAMKGQLR